MVLDDFHNVDVIWLPTKVMLSVAVHMASSLVDIYRTIPALCIPDKKLIHSTPTIEKKDKGEVSEKNM